MLLSTRSLLNKCPAIRAATRNLEMDTLESKEFLPCKYKSEGCLFIDLSPHISEHENSCPCGPTACLLKTPTGCNWAGPMRTFLPHAQLHHTNNIQLNGSSMVYRGFVKEEDVNADSWFHVVFKSLDQIFKCVLNVEYPSGKMRWCVFYFGWERYAGDYTYEIQIEDYNNHSEKISSCSLYDSVTLEQLKCPACREYMHAPIHECQMGHSMCQTCFILLNRCPVCGAPRVATRSLPMEALDSKTLFPCKYKSEGCLFTDFGPYISEHERHCLSRTVLCPLNKAMVCNWMGLVDAFLSHAELQHSNNLYTNGSPIIYHNFVKEESVNANNWFNALVVSENQIFKCVLNVDYSSGTMRWCVFYYGWQRFAGDYTYEIQIEDYNNRSEKILLSSLCKHFKEEEYAFTMNQCLFTNYRFIKRICKNNELGFNVKVNKNNY